MMELIFIKKEDYQSTRKLILEDEIISKASITFKEARSIGIEKDGFYCLISGTEDACKRVGEIKAGEPVRGEEKEKIVRRISEEEETAALGFGKIFG
jgi:hypothetical protein